MRSMKLQMGPLARQAASASARKPLRGGGASPLWALAADAASDRTSAARRSARFTWSLLHDYGILLLWVPIDVALARVVRAGEFAA